MSQHPTGHGPKTPKDPETPQDPKTPKDRGATPRSPLIVAFIGSAVVLLVAVLGLVFLSRLPTTPQVQTTGKALVGGPFTLTDHTGQTVTQETYAGKLKLMYFGFTFCPDACPTRMLAVTRALNMLKEKELEKLQPLLVSIDPERDTPEVMATYVQNFHPSLVGLTGTPEQVEAAAKAYRVTYYKVPSEELGSYLMDHTDIVYLMDANNEYLTHFSYTSTPEEIAKTLRKFL